MYRLKAPVFSGEEDVEQFIAEFSDVAANLGMAPHVALLHKWLCLMEQAKCYEVEGDIDSIYGVL